MTTIMIVGAVILAVFVLFLVIRFGAFELLFDIILAILSGDDDGSSSGGFGGGDSGGGGSSSDF